MLCLLRNFDVYAVQVPRKKAPTKFGFALKSSDKIHLFETPEDDYIHYVCTDSGESLREWLAGLRAAKVGYIWRYVEQRKRKDDFLNDLGYYYCWPIVRFFWAYSLYLTYLPFYGCCGAFLFW
jgi:hypothetical protein